MLSFILRNLGGPKIQILKIKKFRKSPERWVVKAGTYCCQLHPQFRRLRLYQREQERMGDGGLGPRYVLLGPKHGPGTRSELATTLSLCSMMSLLCDVHEVSTNAPPGEYSTIEQHPVVIKLEHNPIPDAMTVACETLDIVWSTCLHLCRRDVQTVQQSNRVQHVFRISLGVLDHCPFQRVSAGSQYL